MGTFFFFFDNKTNGYLNYKINKMFMRYMGKAKLTNENSDSQLKTFAGP